MLTPKQLEIAARKLCKLRGEDPDRRYNGCQRSEWERISWEIKCAEDTQEALKAGREYVEPVEDNPKSGEWRDAASAPKNGEILIAYDSHGNYTYPCGVNWHHGLGMFVSVYGAIIPSFTHWTPYPDPPKKA